MNEMFVTIIPIRNPEMTHENTTYGNTSFIMCGATMQMVTDTAVITAHTNANTT
jgi:hypothetical protein